MLVLLALSLVCSPFFVDRVDHDAPGAERGVLRRLGLRALERADRAEGRLAGGLADRAGPGR
jgi:hypothetical protein